MGGTESNLGGSVSNSGPGQIGQEKGRVQHPTKIAKVHVVLRQHNRAQLTTRDSKQLILALCLGPWFNVKQDAGFETQQLLFPLPPSPLFAACHQVPNSPLQTPGPVLPPPSTLRYPPPPPPTPLLAAFHPMAPFPLLSPCKRSRNQVTSLLSPSSPLQPSPSPLLTASHQVQAIRYGRHQRVVQDAIVHDVKVHVSHGDRLSPGSVNQRRGAEAS